MVTNNEFGQLFVNCWLLRQSQQRRHVTSWHICKRQTNLIWEPTSSLREIIIYLPQYVSYELYLQYSLIPYMTGRNASKRHCKKTFDVQQWRPSYKPCAIINLFQSQQSYKASSRKDYAHCLTFKLQICQKQCLHQDWSFKAEIIYAQQDLNYCHYCTLQHS